MNEGLPLKPGQKITEDELEGLGAVEEEVVEEEPLPELPEPEKMEQKVENLNKLCPRCGWNHSVEFSVDCTPQDKRNFLRSILEPDIDFYKSYKVFNERVNIIFKMPTVEQTDTISSYVKYLSSTGKTDIRLLITEGLKMALTLSIYKIQYLDEKGHTTREVNFEDVRKDVDKNLPEFDELCPESFACFHYHKKMFKKYSPPLYNAVYKKYTDFDELCQYLTARAPEPDFYTATRHYT